jgi:hypothetical protein
VWRELPEDRPRIPVRGKGKILLILAGKAQKDAGDVAASPAEGRVVLNWVVVGSRPSGAASRKAGKR